MRSLLLLLACSSAACGGSSATPDAGIDADTGGGLRDQHVELDILFVVDNGGSTGEEQIALSNAFVELVQLINRAFPRTMSVHIGVVSSDMGTGVDYGVTNCDAAGDGGRLQSEPRRTGCQPPSDPFMSNDPINFPSSDAVAAFECISQLGVVGCGFEQPLEAMRAALDGTVSENQGFLRTGADLLVVIMTDEDDCSAADTTLFDPDATDSWGELSSYRCFRHGIVCDQDLESPGDKTNCRPRDDGPLHPISRYTDFLDSLEVGGRSVYVAAIAGPSEQVTVERLGDEPSLGPGCAASIGQADPAIRIRAVSDHFGDRGFFTSVCADDWTTAALSDVTDWMAGHVGDPCITGIDDADGCVMRRITEQGPVDVERCPEIEILPDGGVVSPDRPDPCWEARSSYDYCEMIRGLDDVRELRYRTIQPPTGDPLELDCP